MNATIIPFGPARPKPRRKARYVDERLDALVPLLKHLDVKAVAVVNEYISAVLLSRSALELLPGVREALVDQPPAILPPPSRKKPTRRPLQD